MQKLYFSSLFELHQDYLRENGVKNRSLLSIWRMAAMNYIFLNEVHSGIRCSA